MGDSPEERKAQLETAKKAMEERYEEAKKGKADGRTGIRDDKERDGISTNGGTQGCARTGERILSSR
jgi:hypothetical protein